jgi:hypothetical protein
MKILRLPPQFIFAASRPGTRTFSFRLGAMANEHISVGQRHLIFQMDCPQGNLLHCVFPNSPDK